MSIYEYEFEVKRGDKTIKLLNDLKTVVTHISFKTQMILDIRIYILYFFFHKTYSYPSLLCHCGRKANPAGMGREEKHWTTSQTLLTDIEKYNGFTWKETPGQSGSLDMKCRVSSSTLRQVLVS